MICEQLTQEMHVIIKVKLGCFICIVKGEHEGSFLPEYSYPRELHITCELV